VAALLAGLALWIVKAVVRGVPGPVDAVGVVANVGTGAALATIGTIMIVRVPRNPIGWFFGAVATWMATTFLVVILLYFLNSPGDVGTDLANWLGNWTFVISVPTPLILMFFPSGALPSPRWRILPWLAIIGTVGWATSEATTDRLGLDPGLPNPYSNHSLARVGEVVSLLLLPALFGTIASLVVRYRGSSPDVRLQIKWVSLAGAFQIVVMLGLWALYTLQPEAFGPEAAAVGGLSLLAIPIALGVAILKYRLYDIDRLVSRTVSYAVLGSLLAGVFFAGVLGTQAVFGASSDLAVAGTTLAVAALFDPLRRRLHGLMDRKFNRQRFDFERVVEAFSTRVSSVTDTDDLASDLSATLEQTLAPASIGLWVRR
jgi:hypothetical protein